MQLLAVGAVAVFALGASRAVRSRARVGLDFDSFDYLDLARHKSVVGLLGAHRPPVYLLALKLVGENRQAVTWLQLLLNLAAWVWLAAATGRCLRTRPARIAAFGAILLLGSCLDIGQWDRVIGTESFSISLGVLIVAATLWWWGRWSHAATAALCLLVVLWALLATRTRSSSAWSAWSCSSSRRSVGRPGGGRCSSSGRSRSSGRRARS